MIANTTKHSMIGWLVAAIALTATVIAPSAQAETGFDADMTFYVSVGKACEKAGSAECGSLIIGRDRLKSGNSVRVSFYHQVCLGNVSEWRYRWVHSRVVRTSGNRFYVKIDRSRIKLKLRGRFVDGRGSGSSLVKGTLSFRNLGRNCGFRPFGFRQFQSGPTTDPQG